VKFIPSALEPNQPQHGHATACSSILLPSFSLGFHSFNEIFNKCFRTVIVLAYFYICKTCISGNCISRGVSVCHVHATVGQTSM
jgi:hypothetical protein